MKELIKICKFFKGEKENPFDWNTQNKENQFWEYEKTFVNKYEIGLEFKGMNPEQAMKKYLQDLFIHLADKYETGKDYFKNLYND